VPLYARLVDPFTSDEALWEFENLFVLSGKTKGEWLDVSSRLLGLRNGEPNEQSAQAILGEVRKFVTYCADFFALTSDDK
jgi:hypothetical protein